MNKKSFTITGIFLLLISVILAFSSIGISESSLSSSSYHKNYTGDLKKISNLSKEKKVETEKIREIKTNNLYEYSKEANPFLKEDKLLLKPEIESESDTKFIIQEEFESEKDRKLVLVLRNGALLTEIPVRWLRKDCSISKINLITEIGSKHGEDGYKPHVEKNLTVDNIAREIRIDFPESISKMKTTIKLRDSSKCGSKLNSALIIEELYLKTG